MGWRQDGIRARVTRGVFGVESATLSTDEADDDFTREPLVLPRPRRARTSLGDATTDTATASDGPALRLPSVRLGRKEAAVTLLLLAGVLGLLLDPALPAAVLAGLVDTVPVTQDSPVVPSGPLAPFDGWRIAYIGEDARLYVVTSDGFTTLAGPQLSGLHPGGAYVASASPDGYRIAYASSTSGVALIDLTGVPAKPAVRAFPAVGTPLYWSPDGTRLALTTVTGQLAVLDTLGGRLSILPTHLVPASLFQLGEVQLLGWTDPAHLAAATLDPRRGTAQLAVVDANTGVARTLLRLPIGNALPGFAISPNGSKILMYANAAAGGPSSVWLIDTSSGSDQTQPGIAQGLDGRIVAAVWNGNSDTLVAATLVEPRIDPRNHQSLTNESPLIHTWTLDTSTDYDALQRSYGIPLGWMPANGPLIYGDWNAQEGGTDSYVLLRSYLLTLRGMVTTHLIDGAAGNLTFVGFVRTR